MKLFIFFTAFVLFSYCGISQADVHPERLNAFYLASSGLLQGFTPHSDPLRSNAANANDNSGAEASLSLRYFYGASELNYSVLLFPTQTALRTWDDAMHRAEPGWTSPSYAPLSPTGVRQRELGGVVQPPGLQPTAIVVNRIVIIVSSYQHSEAIRHHPQLVRTSLSNKALARRLKQIKAVLTARARSLPANKG